MVKAVVSSWNIFIVGNVRVNLVSGESAFVRRNWIRDRLVLAETRESLVHLFLLANSGGRATTCGLEMQMEEALDFRDGLRQVEGTVRARDDEFGLRAVEVRALI